MRRSLVVSPLGIALPDSLAADPLPWHTVVCSRLGHNRINHRLHLAMLRRFTEQAVARGDRPLIVHDTAAHPWSQRACELLRLDPVRLSIEKKANSNWTLVEAPATCCRDRLAIELADRVDATFVRPKGNILQLLCERLGRDPAAMIQVLVTSKQDAAAKELIACGAIGYWLPIEPQTAATSPIQRLSQTATTRTTIRSLLDSPEKWLIHSTRARTGPWPGESEQQFRDWLLLSPPHSENSTPLETLQRIVREQRLVGTHRTTSSDQPVVCFTSLPMAQWLSRRKFRPHLGRWDAEPYGIALRRDAAMKQGVQPVVYGDQDVLERSSDDERWRFQSTGKTYDWTAEAEWRGRGVIDLTSFDDGDVIVFVNQPYEANELAHSPWPIVAVAGDEFK